MQLAMSAQLVMACTQPEFAKSGQVETEPQPIEASVSSSALPQILSAPPHAPAIVSVSLLARAPSTGWVFGSLVQTCVAGSLPFVLASSHFCNAFARFCTYVADCLAIPSLHFTASAAASCSTASATTSVIATATRTRVLVMGPPRHRPILGGTKAAQFL